ncbi:ribonuclease H-like domain-containing protein [Tanacetum coccineum]
MVTDLSPIILKKWTPNANLLKEDLKSVHIWVKYIPIVAFTAEGLSVMATKLGNPIMANQELKEDLVIAIPNVEDDGEVLHTVRVGIKEPPNVEEAVDDLANEDNDSEVEDVYDETATYMASKSFNVNKASKSGSGGEKKTLDCIEILPTRRNQMQKLRSGGKRKSEYIEQTKCVKAVR